MKALVDLGVAPPRAAEWAETAMAWMSSLAMSGKTVGSIYIRTYPDGDVSILPDDHFIKEPPRPDAEVVLQLNLRSIFDRVRKELAAITSD
jgi:hypothetical protein